MFNQIRAWFSPPTFEGDEDKTRIAALLNSIVWMFITSASLYGAFAPIEPALRWRRIVIIIPFDVLMVIVKLLINKGYIRLTGNFVVFSLWLVFTAAMYFGADYHNPAYMGFLLVVICAGLILHWRSAIGWGIISILTNGLVIQLGEMGVLRKTQDITPAFAFWVAQTVYIITATFLLSQTLRKIDEAHEHAIREINERKRAEAERERVIKELEAKNAELERFTYTVSHDLKSPLITIGGFVGLLEEDARSGNKEKFDNDLKRIREAKDKMHRLLNELLELSRIGRIMNPPTQTPFSQIVEEALALTRGQLMANNIQVDVSKKFPVVSGDRPRLVEVLQNLIDNASKFMGDQPEPRIVISSHEKDGETVFFVSDNGIGIEKEFHQKIFGLFDKLNPISDGTGVGLALVKRIIEVHGGRIWVESEGKGKGSTFYFTLPQTPKTT